MRGRKPADELIDNNPDFRCERPIAATAKAGCPVTKLLKVEIGFEATLSP